MTNIVITVALMSQTMCTEAQPIKVGDTAPCAGLLMPADMVRAALRCKKVQLPELQARLDYQTEIANAAAQRHSAEISFYRAAVGAEPEPWWVLPAIAVGFAGIGYAAGSLVSR